MLRVIDTSHWKKDIVNTNVDIDGVYTKATEGNYYVDDACDPIVQWAIGRGKKWGVYHFATNRVTDPITEANYFVDNCQGYVGHGLLILDNENYHWSDGTFANDANNVGWAKQWLDQVFARTGVKPLIYMSLSVITGNDWSPVINGGYGLICADYVENDTPIPNWSMDSNRDPNPHWDGVVNDVMWQFTSTGRLDGYGGNLDCNFFYGDAHAWDLYAGVHADTPPPVQPAPEPAPTPTPPDPQPTPQPPASTDPAPAPAPSPPDPGTVIPPTTPPADPGTGPIINDPLPPTPQPKPTPTPTPPTPGEVDGQVQTDLNSLQAILEKIRAFKPGIKTSEFWQVAVVNVTTFIEGVVKNHVLAVRVTALIVIGVLTLAYVWSRTHVKKAIAQKL